MIYHGDLFDVLPTLDASSIDACVTDPPYGIGFMGKEWDSFKPGLEAKRIVPNRAIASENPNLKGRTRGPASSPSAVDYDRTLEGQRAFQDWTAGWACMVYSVLKPGAHLLVCGAPRSFHRMTCGLEDAGFEVRDCLSWLYGQGFPKSLNLPGGLGTALKPAWEPIIVARRPFKGSLTVNVERHGTGVLNIDACRVGDDDDEAVVSGFLGDANRSFAGVRERVDRTIAPTEEAARRWPANVLLDVESAALLDEQTGELVSGGTPYARAGLGYSGRAYGQADVAGNDGDRGGASRFYYVAKPSREERDYGVERFEPVRRSDGRKTEHNVPNLRTKPQRNFHPTVKPVELMRWLVRLVTPPNGTVLDPFAGSGTTGMACRYELREFIGIEREAEYVAIAERRIAAVAPLFTERSESAASVGEERVSRAGSQADHAR